MAATHYQLFLKSFKEVEYNADAKEQHGENQDRKFRSSKVVRHPNRKSMLRVLQYRSQKEVFHQITYCCDHQ